MINRVLIDTRPIYLAFQPESIHVMSLVGNGSVLDGSIPCVVSGCLAARTQSSSTCPSHRPNPRPTRSTKTRRQTDQAAQDATPSGDNCRPRTLRFVNDVDVSIQAETGPERSSPDVDLGSALSWFLLEQQAQGAPQHLAASSAQTVKLP